MRGFLVAKERGSGLIGVDFCGKARVLGHKSIPSIVVSEMAAEARRVVEGRRQMATPPGFFRRFYNCPVLVVPIRVANNSVQQKIPEEDVRRRSNSRRWRPAQW